MWAYTTILHSVKKQFGLTELDYCIIDTIARLSAGGTATHRGWCNASNKFISDALYTSPKNIISVTKKAIQKGLLEVMDMGIGNVPLKRATEKWHNAINLAQDLTPKVTGEITPKVTPPNTKGNTPVLPLVTPPITIGNYIDNDSYNNVDSNKEKVSDLKKSPPTKAKKVGFNIEAVTNPEHLKISPTLFEKLKEFLTARIERKASNDKITDRTWSLMIGQLAKAANEFKEDALLVHMDNGIVNNWKSPFFNGYQDAIKRIKIERPPEPLKPIPRIENEPLIENPAHEEWYCKNKVVLEGINKDFYINRSQWLQLIVSHRRWVVPRKFDIAILKAASESNPHNLFANMDKELHLLSGPEIEENNYILAQRKNAQNG